MTLEIRGNCGFGYRIFGWTMCVPAKTIKRELVKKNVSLIISFTQLCQDIW